MILFYEKSMWVLKQTTDKVRGLDAGRGWFYSPGAVSESLSKSWMELK